MPALPAAIKPLFREQARRIKDLTRPPQFDVAVFLWEWFVTSAFPLSLFAVLLREGVAGFFAREILGTQKSWMMIMMSWLLPAMTWSLVISFGLGYRDGSALPFQVEVVSAFSLLLIRNTTIAVKHAFRHPYQRDLFRKGLVNITARRAEEVVFGLLPQPPDSVAHDLVESAYRLGITEPHQLVVLRAEDTMEGLRWSAWMRKLMAGTDGGAWKAPELAGDQHGDDKSCAVTAREESAHELRSPTSASIPTPRRAWMNADIATSGSSDKAVVKAADLVSSFFPSTRRTNREGSRRFRGGAKKGDASSKQAAPALVTASSKLQLHLSSAVQALADADPPHPAAVKWWESVPTHPSSEEGSIDPFSSCVPLAHPFVHQVGAPWAIRPLAFLPDIVKASSENGKPPVMPGSYVVVPMSALALHIRLLDSFALQDHVRKDQQPFYLQPSFVWYMRALFTLPLMGLPTVGRWLDGVHPVTEDTSSWGFVSFVIAEIVLMIMGMGFMASFVTGLVLSAARHLWTMQRLTDLIRTPTPPCTEYRRSFMTTSLFQPEQGEATEVDHAAVARRTDWRRSVRERKGAATASSKVQPMDQASPRDDERKSAAVAAVQELRVAGVERSAPVAKLDLRFRGAINAFVQLRRWLPAANASTMLRIQWVVFLMIAIIFGCAVRVLIDSVLGAPTPFAFLLPAMHISLAAFIPLLLFIILGAKHNELLVNHATLIRQNELAIESQFHRHEGSGAGATVSSTSEAAEAVRRNTPRWGIIRDGLRTAGLLIDAEAIDDWIGPKQRLGQIAINRTLVRVLLTSSVSAILFILQQSVFAT